MKVSREIQGRSMGNQFLCCSFLLLLLVMHAAGNAARGQMEDAGGNVLRLPSQDSAQQTEEVKHHHHHHDAHSNMAHMDSAKMFFILNDIKDGKTMRVYFPRIDDASKSFHFLPREEADAIPFSSAALPYLLRFFSFSQDSPQAKAMAQTLTVCESEAMKGEIKACPTSLGSLLDFARSGFGSDAGVQFLKTTHITKLASSLQNYTVLQHKEIEAPRAIACHSLSYPYTVLYCHAPAGGVKLFKLLLRGEKEDMVDAVSLCHMDTSEWDPEHVSFRLLGVKPGTSEVCHVFPADNLILVPAPTL